MLSIHLAVCCDLEKCLKGFCDACVRNAIFLRVLTPDNICQKENTSLTSSRYVFPNRRTDQQLSRKKKIFIVKVKNTLSAIQGV